MPPGGFPESQEDCSIVQNMRLYYILTLNRLRIVRKNFREKTHQNRMARHFFGQRVYNTLARNLLACIPTLRSSSSHVSSLGVVGERNVHPYGYPIHVSRPFQIIGVDEMDLPVTSMQWEQTCFSVSRLFY